MIDWLQNGEVVLGLAISFYTLYSFLEARVRERRQRYVLLKQICNDMEYFVALAKALGKRAQQVEGLYAEYFSPAGYPDPARDADSLPEDAERTSAWLGARAQHLADYQIAHELDKVGAVLSREQADALFALLEARRVYVEVLMTRAMDLDAFPRRPGVLKRFVGVAVLNADPMRKKLDDFAKSLALPNPTQ